MSVVDIDSKMPFKFRGPRAHEDVSEGLGFLAGVALTFWLPTIMYCLVIGQFLPFRVMIYDQALGAVLGVLMHHRRQSVGHLPCVPVDHLPNVLDSDAPPREIKKAA